MNRILKMALKGVASIVLGAASVYLGKQAFDFFCPSWRGIAYVYIGTPNGGVGEWNDVNTFTRIDPIAFATPVQVINTATAPVHVDLAAADSITIANTAENPVNTKEVPQA